MIKNHRYTVIILMISSFVWVAGCGPSAPTAVPSGVSVTNITEENTTNREITQQKTFDQCDSGSSFKAEVSFSDSSNQQASKELILGVKAGGGAGVSKIAQITLEGQIEQHFASSSQSGQGHQETVSIDIPARTKQEYKIVWREIRREGSIEYVENGVTKSVDYSYRTGLELDSAKGTELQCPGGAPGPAPSPTSAPPVIPDTPISSPPQVLDTAPGSVLQVGESWKQNGLVLTLAAVKFNPQPDWGTCYISLSFHLENFSPDPRIITVRHSLFEITDNFGRTDIQHGISSYTYPCPSTSEQDDFSQEVGVGERFPKEGNWYVGVGDDITNPALEYVSITVNGLSEINGASWKIEIKH